MEKQCRTQVNGAVVEAEKLEAGNVIRSTRMCLNAVCQLLQDTQSEPLLPPPKQKKKIMVLDQSLGSHLLQPLILFYCVHV